MEGHEFQGFLENLQQEMRNGFANVREEFATVRQEMADMRTENAREHEKTRRYAEALNDDTRREFREELQAVASDLRDVEKSLRDDIRAVADGVLANTERIDRVETEMRMGFAEVRELIYLSNTAIEQRFRRIENG